MMIWRSQAVGRAPQAEPLKGCALALGALLLLSVVGCGPKDLPEAITRYALMDPEESLRVLAERAKLVHTLNGQGLITLTREDGESVRLDGLIVMRPPDHTRLRASKFDRVVFDLTVKPEGVWLLTPEDPKRREQILRAGASVTRLVRQLALLNGGFFEPGPDRGAAEVHGDRLRVARHAGGQSALTCEVDRATLTPRRYTLVDDTGKTHFTLTLDRYRQFGEVVWPMRMTATSEEGGVIEVDLREVEVNPELPGGAFTPPGRAEKLP